MSLKYEPASAGTFRALLVEKDDKKI